MPPMRHDGGVHGPGHAPTSRAQAPAALTTLAVSKRPSLVSTPVTRPSRVAMPRTSQRVTQARAELAAFVQVALQETRHVHDAVQRAPESGLERGALQERHATDARLRAPPRDLQSFEFLRGRVRRDSLQRGARTGQERSAGMKLDRLIPIARDVTDELSALAGERGDGAAGDDHTQDRRVPSRGVEAGDLLLLEDDDVARAEARELVGGGGTGEPAADDDEFGVWHRQPGIILAGARAA